MVTLGFPFVGNHHLYPFVSLVMSLSHQETVDLLSSFNLRSLVEGPSCSDEDELPRLPPKTATGRKSQGDTIWKYVAYVEM